MTCYWSGAVLRQGSVLAVLAFFRLRFDPFLPSRQAEEDFWQALDLQCRIPDAQRPLALYRLCSDELVKDSLGPAPSRVARVDATCLVPCNSVLLSTIGIATTFMSVSELKAL